MPDSIDDAVDLSGVPQAEPNDPTPGEVVAPNAPDPAAPEAPYPTPAGAVAGEQRANAVDRLALIRDNMRLIERRMSRNSFDGVSIRWWDQMKEAASDG